MTETAREPFAGWCILELFGHRRLGGYVTEQEIAGAAFIRIDVPDEPGPTGQEYQATQFYSASAIYAITPTTEEIARALAARNRPAPVQRWELPALEPASVRVPDDEDDLGEDGDRDDEDCLPF